MTPKTYQNVLFIYLIICLFAHDASLLLTNKNIDEIERIYNAELKHIKDWLDANKKSNWLLFRNTKKKKISKQIIVAIIGKEIMEKEYIKYLGILIDNEGILIIPY